MSPAWEQGLGLEHPQPSHQLSCGQSELRAGLLLCSYGPMPGAFSPKQKSLKIISMGTPQALKNKYWAGGQKEAPNDKKIPFHSWATLLPDVSGEEGALLLILG